MALPTGKQSPHRRFTRAGLHNPFAPEWNHWDPTKVDVFGELIHEHHLENFHKLLKVIERNRPIHVHESKLRYTRGHPRQNGQKLWIPYSESRNHTHRTAFPEALPDDHVMVTHPVAELWAEVDSVSLQIFPQHAESRPRYGLNLNRDGHRHSPLNGYYLSDYGVIQVAYGRINRLMPYDAINLQVHEFESKLVWKAGAADRLDLTQYVFEHERLFTTEDWKTAAWDPEQFITNIKHGFINHSGGHWTKEHDLMLTDVLKDTTSRHVSLALDNLQRGMDPHNKALAATLESLYSFDEQPAGIPTWATYEEFLRSPEWQAKRQAVIKRSGGYCESCSVTGTRTPAVHVHHVHYKKAWGQEDPTDLLHLCEAHHKLAHGNTRP